MIEVTPWVMVTQQWATYIKKHATAVHFASNFKFLAPSLPKIYKMISHCLTLSYFVPSITSWLLLFFMHWNCFLYHFPGWAISKSAWSKVFMPWPRYGGYHFPSPMKNHSNPYEKPQHVSLFDYAWRLVRKDYLKMSQKIINAKVQGSLK